MFLTLVADSQASETADTWIRPAEQETHDGGRVWAERRYRRRCDGQRDVFKSISNEEEDLEPDRTGEMHSLSISPERHPRSGQAGCQGIGRACWRAASERASAERPKDKERLACSATTSMMTCRYESFSYIESAQRTTILLNDVYS